jgi:hypothetical protein
VRNWEVRFALNNGHRQPDLLGRKVPEQGLIRPSMKRAMPHEPPDYSGSPTAGASDASKHIQELARRS